MVNHPNRSRRPTLARKAERLGFELSRDHSLQQGDDGYWRARWRLHALVNGKPSPYQAASSFFRTLQEVDDALDYAQIVADRLE